MKKAKYYLLFFMIISFAFTQKASAGICSGKSIANHSDDTCALENISYRFHSHEHSKSGGYSVFKVNGADSYSHETEYGMCLDPNLPSPYDGNGIPYDYNYGRDIVPSNGGADQTIYRVYQQYVNASGYNYSDQYLYLRYSDIIYRYLMSTNNWSLKDYTYDSSKLFDNAAAKSFYDNATSLNMWENPLSFKTSVDYDSETEMYTFKIDMMFTNDTSKYFYTNTDGLINGDYNIGYGDAYLEYTLKINDGLYGFGNAKEYPDDITGKITKYNENPNATKTFEVKMEKKVYDDIMQQQGEVFVNLTYKTYHPMSHENVAILKRDAANTGNQRMLVFTKYEKNGSVSTNGETDIDDFKVSLCSQEGNNFYYDGTKVTIDKYISECSCALIDNTLLTGVTTQYYNQQCPLTDTIDVESTLNSCYSEDELGTNTVTKTKTKSIKSERSNNSYCKYTCDENIKIENFTGIFSTVSGTYFELPNPKLTATKNCKLEVDYTSWQKDYIKILKQEISAYNKYLHDYAIANPYKSKDITCSCGENCTYTATREYYKYNNYYYEESSDEILYRESDGSYSTCKSTPSIDINGSWGAFITRKDNLEKHFENLQFCNTYLSTLDEKRILAANEFYKLQADLSFHYEQEYIKNNKKNVIKGNHEKLNGEPDDSGLVISNTNVKSASGDYESYNNIGYYKYITESDTNADKMITNEFYKSPGVNSISRSVGYVYNYAPKQKKYVDVLSGIVSGNKSSLKNPIELGYVYDTDVTAKAKSNNENEYRFSTLGDNNEIATYLKNKGEDYKLNRSCTYITTNKLIPEENFDLVYRVVAPNNIDPNDRKSENKGLKNWTKEKIKEVNELDTFNPDNLEYSFTLDAQTIQKIRSSNENYSYSSLEQYKCEKYRNSEISTGNKCKSTFVDTYANSYKGRDNWK